MKSFEKHIKFLFVSVGLFLAFGNVAFAANLAANHEVSSSTSKFENSNKSKAYVGDVVNSAETTQSNSHHEYLGLDFASTYVNSQNLQFISVSEDFKGYFSSEDKRELILKFLFPFHFFW